MLKPVNVFFLLDEKVTKTYFNTLRNFGFIIATIIDKILSLVIGY